MQYGAYARVATPRIPLWATPQVFQGISTDVTVPASSKVRLRFSGARPLSSNASLNIFPGTTIAMYWSEARMLKAMQVPTVRLISPNTLFTPEISAAVIR